MILPVQTQQREEWHETAEIIGFNSFKLNTSFDQFS